jgi:hypothetical protein
MSTGGVHKNQAYSKALSHQVRFPLGHAAAPFSLFIDLVPFTIIIAISEIQGDDDAPAS